MRHLLTCDACGQPTGAVLIMDGPYEVDGRLVCMDCAADIPDDTEQAAVTEDFSKAMADVRREIAQSLASPTVPETTEDPAPTTSQPPQKAPRRCTSIQLGQERHFCRHAEGHPPPHQCGACSATWS